MSKPRIIVFIGPVGAGKSTQISYLTQYLRKRHEKVKSTYLKTYFFLTQSMFRVFRGLGISKEGLYRIHHTLVMIDLMINVFLLSLLALFRVKLVSKFYKYILIEEYLPGILVDYIHATIVLKLNKRFVLKLINLLSRLLYIRNLITIMLVCSPTSLPHRWRLRNSLPEFPQYLETQSHVFVTWSERAENVFQVLTENKSIEETNKEIKELLSL